ncbi:MAG TPA: nicotinamide riboside transporter PnuC [Planctomycetota bacterium]|nr:nicotinamide riboside transporter PnuC [Planctomycetota bacterium]
MSLLEWIGALLGVVCVALTIVRSLWCWPVGLGMVAVYLVVFHDARLYADMGLQAVYIVLQLYGWWYWWRGTGDRAIAVPVRRIDPRSIAPWCAATIGASWALGAALARWTDASLPWWDATAAVMSLVAQWLMGRRVLESWLVWIAVDALSIGIFLAKDLLPTAGLYAVFLVMAAVGFATWRRAPRDAMPATAAIA